PLGPLPAGTVPPYEVSLDRRPLPVAARLEGLDPVSLLRRSDERMRDLGTIEVTLHVLGRDDGVERRPPVTETVDVSPHFEDGDASPLPMLVSRLADRGGTRKVEVADSFRTNPQPGMAFVIGEG